MSDAQRDPATSEFTQCYREPLGITAMLDVPIWAGDTLHGVLCCEHIGPERVWSVDEVRFATDATAHIVIALATAEQRKAEEALRAVRQQGQAGHCWQDR